MESPSPGDLLATPWPGVSQYETETETKTERKREAERESECDAATVCGSWPKTRVCFCFSFFFEKGGLGSKFAAKANT